MIKKAPSKKKPARNASHSYAGGPTKTETPKEASETVVMPKLRIKIKAYDHKIIDSSVKQIVDTARRFGAEVVGPVPIPSEIHKYTVNRSSFVHKNAREQYEMRVHKRLIDIMNPTPKTIDALINLNLPAGVDIEIKI